MSATTRQLLSSGEFCILRYDTITVKSASAKVSFYTNNSKMPNFELWHSCRKWMMCCLYLCHYILAKHVLVSRTTLWMYVSVLTVLIERYVCACILKGIRIYIRYMFRQLSAVAYRCWIEMNLRDFRLPPRCKWDLSLFRDVARRRLVVKYRHFGTSYRYHLQGWSIPSSPSRLGTAWHFKMGPIACPEKSPANYQPTLRNIPDDERSHCIVPVIKFGVQVHFTQINITRISKIVSLNVFLLAVNFLCNISVVVSIIKTQKNLHSPSTYFYKYVLLTGDQFRPELWPPSDHNNTRKWKYTEIIDHYAGDSPFHIKIH